MSEIRPGFVDDVVDRAFRYFDGMGWVQSVTIPVATEHDERGFVDGMSYRKFQRYHIRRPVTDDPERAKASIRRQVQHYIDTEQAAT